MKILVLGASGLVGWNLLRVARPAGHECVGTYHAHPQRGLVPLDLENHAALVDLLKSFVPEAVFYCSGWTWVDGCEGDPARAFHANAESPARVAREVDAIGAAFVYFSTSYVFDGKAGPYGEDDPPSPISVYGNSKLTGENEVLKAMERALVARTMGVYGPEPQEKNFVYQVRKTLSAGQRLRVPNDQFGNVTYAPDLAAMAIELVKQGRRGVWNLAGPDPCICRSDFALNIAQSYGLSTGLIDPVDTASLRQPAPRPVQGGLKIEKAVEATSIIPRPWVKLP
jgi:dTDP-4-dehydrorhamnose reductase